VRFDKIGAVRQVLDDAQLSQIFFPHLFGLHSDDLDSKGLCRITQIYSLIDLGVPTLTERMRHEQVFVLNAGLLVLEGHHLRPFLHSIVEV
jgi:hypothetical protein